MKSKVIPKNSFKFNFTFQFVLKGKFYRNMLYRSSELKVKPMLSMTIITMSLIIIHTYIEKYLFVVASLSHMVTHYLQNT